MIKFPQDVNFIHENVCVPDESFIDDFDDTIRIGRLFELGPIYSTVATSPNGLNKSHFTLG